MILFAHSLIITKKTTVVAFVRNFKLDIKRCSRAKHLGHGILLGRIHHPWAAGMKQCPSLPPDSVYWQAVQAVQAQQAAAFSALALTTLSFLPEKGFWNALKISIWGLNSFFFMFASFD
jgi:hypothetical protein